MGANVGRRAPHLLVAAFLVALVWFALGMHRGLLLSNQIKELCYPWAGVTHETGLDAPELSDPVQQFVPWLQFARREVVAGRLPLWNPHQDGGVPLLGNAQSALLSPLNLPALLLGVERGWNLVLLLKLVLAAVGTFLWLRESAASRPAALLGALSFSLSGSFIAWLEHPHTLAAAPVPLVLLFVSRLRRRPAVHDVAGLAISTWLVLVGGHPETALMAFLVVGAANVSGPWSPVALRRIAFGSLLGIGLAAPVLLTFAEYFAASEAYQLPSARHSFTLPVEALIRYLLPGASAGHVIEGAASVSLVTLVLALLGVCGVGRNPSRWRWGLLALAMVSMAYANPVSSFLAAHTPIYWSRIVLFVPLPLAALAAGALDGIVGLVRARGLRVLATAVPAGAVVAALVDLLGNAAGVHAATPPGLLRMSTPVLELLAAEREPFRVLPLGNVLAPNFATAVGLDDLRGYDAMTPAAWRRARESIGHFEGDMMAVGNLAHGGRGLDLWNVKYILARPDIPVRVDVLNRVLGLDLEEAYAGLDGRLWRNRRVLDRVRVEGPGRARVLERTPTRWLVAVSAPAPTTLVVADPYFPGWVVRVEGKPTSASQRVGNPIEVPVNDGEQLVEIAYEPVSLRLGTLLAILAAVALGATAWRDRAVVRRTANGQDEPGTR